MAAAFTGSFGYAGTGAQAATAAPAVGLKYIPTTVCSIEGTVIANPTTSVISADLLVAPTNGTATLIGSDPEHFTGAQVVLSITRKFFTPGVETCIYSASSISFTPPAAPIGLPILGAPLILDKSDSGVDCPTFPPLSVTVVVPVDWALTRFDSDHFTLTTVNDSNANLEFKCAEQH